jgi:hypothetical protein
VPGEPTDRLNASLSLGLSLDAVYLRVGIDGRSMSTARRGDDESYADRFVVAVRSGGEKLPPRWLIRRCRSIRCGR